MPELAAQKGGNKLDPLFHILVTHTRKEHTERSFSNYLVLEFALGAEIVPDVDSLDWLEFEAFPKTNNFKKFVEDNKFNYHGVNET